MEIITGRTGTPHVYAADDAELYKLFLGSGDYLLTTGNRLSAQMIGTQQVRVADGSIIMQGRLAKTRKADGYDTLTLDIGTVGYKRVDLIVAEYKQETVNREEVIEGETVNVTDILESVVIKVVKGTPNATQYVEPTITTGNIDNGETHQVPLWAIRFDGINNGGLIDRRPAMLDTTPIETAISVANNSVTQIRAQMASLQTDVYQYASDLIAGISQGIKGQWKQAVTVSDATSPIQVTMGNTYSYLATDIIDVYLNGFKLTANEYSVTGSNSTINVTLTAPTFTGQMEVVATRLAEEA